MREYLLHSSLRACALAGLVFASAGASAANPTVSWIEPRSNAIIDRQVTQAVGDRGTGRAARALE
jgi:hypothetical protein